MKPRCGRVMLRYKAASAEGMTYCGRPTGHNGDCRSVEAVSRYQVADVRRITVKRQQDRLSDVAADRPASRSGCGAYLAFLLHQAKGEEPCGQCIQAAADRLEEQAARDTDSACRQPRKQARWEAAA